MGDKGSGAIGNGTPDVGGPGTLGAEVVPAAQDEALRGSRHGEVGWTMEAVVEEMVRKGRQVSESMAWEDGAGRRDVRLRCRGGSIYLITCMVGLYTTGKYRKYRKYLPNRGFK